MKQSDLEMQELEQILARMKVLAGSYVPEWHPDNSNPDAGMALTHIFAHMLMDTQKLTALLPQKNQIEFFRQLRCELLPKRAAHGYITFGLVNDSVPGVQVEKGTTVFAPHVGESAHQVICETTEDIFVTPAKIMSIVQTSQKKDYIHCEEIKEKIHFRAFDTSKDNQQKHEIYIGHDSMLDIRSHGEVVLGFESGAGINTDWAGLLGEKDVQIAYFSDLGFVPFSAQRVEGNCLILSKDENAPAFYQKSIQYTAYWIRLTISNIHPFINKRIKEITIKSRGKDVIPHAIYGKDGQCSLTECYPFGKQMGVYSEVYFGSSEALQKRGAHITLGFPLEFDRIPSPAYVEPETNWNWVMKSSDFKQKPEYEIGISQVVWEYYNGFGWNRLEMDEDSSRVFTKGSSHQQYKEIHFICPDDMHYVVVGSVGSYYIRAKVLSMYNEYKLGGFYVPPVMGEARFSYEYCVGTRCPKYMGINHNLEMEIKTKDEMPQKEWKPFPSMDGKGSEIYFGFACPPIGGPIRILVTTAKTYFHTSTPFTWEYYGSRGWENIRLADETEQFSKTGLMTMIGSQNFMRRVLFGMNMYWIRCRDDSDYFQNAEQPLIKGMHINTTKASVIPKYGGDGSNLPAGAIQKLHKSIGYINSVTNVLDFTGGADEERLEDGLRRNAAILKHGYRALTAKDFEMLALEASPYIRKAACFTGYNQMGKKEVGAVTLVLLQKNGVKGTDAFESVKSEIEQWIQSKMSHQLLHSGKFSIVEPQFVEIAVNASVSVCDFNHVFAVRNDIVSSMERYCDPVFGNHQKGWDIGTFPHIHQIKNVIYGVLGITGIHKVSVTLYRRHGGHREEMDIRYLEEMPFVLPVNGNHVVDISVDKEMR